jgi:hypothetical protein
MKPSLERTAIVAKDICEQPDTEPFLAIIPEHNLSLSCASYDAVKDAVHLYDKSGKSIAGFSAHLGWLVVLRDRVELTTREAQIRRLVDNQVAEHTLTTKLAKDAGALVTPGCDDLSHSHADAEQRPTGQYL